MNMHIYLRRWAYPCPAHLRKRIEAARKDQQCIGWSQAANGFLSKFLFCFVSLRCIRYSTSRYPLCRWCTTSIAYISASGRTWWWYTVFLGILCPPNVHKNTQRVQRTYQNVGAPNHNHWCAKRTCLFCRSMFWHNHSSDKTLIYQHHPSNNALLKMLHKLRNDSFSGSNWWATIIRWDFEVMLQSFWLASITGARMEEAEGGIKQPCSSKQGIASFWKSFDSFWIRRAVTTTVVLWAARTRDHGTGSCVYSQGMQIVCCVQKEVHPGKRSFNLSILGGCFKQVSPTCSDTWVSPSSRAVEKGGTGFHWVCEVKDCWSKPRTYSQHWRPDTKDLLPHVFR